MFRLGKNEKANINNIFFLFSRTQNAQQQQHHNVSDIVIYSECHSDSHGCVYDDLNQEPQTPTKRIGALAANTSLTAVMLLKTNLQAEIEKNERKT